MPPIFLRTMVGGVEQHLRRMIRAGQLPPDTFIQMNVDANGVLHGLEYSHRIPNGPQTGQISRQVVKDPMSLFKRLIDGGKAQADDVAKAIAGHIHSQNWWNFRGPLLAKQAGFVALVAAPIAYYFWPAKKVNGIPPVQSPLETLGLKA